MDCLAMKRGAMRFGKPGGLTDEILKAESVDGSHDAHYWLAVVDNCMLVFAVNLSLAKQRKFVVLCRVWTI